MKSKHSAQTMRYETTHPAPSHPYARSTQCTERRGHVRHTETFARRRHRDDGPTSRLQAPHRPHHPCIRRRMHARNDPPHRSNRSASVRSRRSPDRTGPHGTAKDDAGHHRTGHGDAMQVLAMRGEDIAAHDAAREAQSNAASRNHLVATHFSPAITGAPPCRVFDEGSGVA